MDFQFGVSPVWLVPPMVPGVVIRSRYLAGSSLASWQAARASSGSVIGPIASREI